MENQHKHIKGYRDLSQAEIDLMNRGKALAEEVGDFVHELAEVSGRNLGGGDAPAIDLRWLNIAKTDLQKGFMSLVRSIAQPTTF